MQNARSQEESTSASLSGPDGGFGNEAVKLQFPTLSESIRELGCPSPSPRGDNYRRIAGHFCRTPQDGIS